MSALWLFFSPIASASPSLPDPLEGVEPLAWDAPLFAERVRRRAEAARARAVAAGARGIGSVGVVGCPPWISYVPTDRRFLDEVIKRDLNAIRYCYQRAVNRGLRANGKIEVRFTITPDGSTRDVVVREDTIGHPEVGACVADRFARMRFSARPNGIIIVRYPFTFSIDG